MVQTKTTPNPSKADAIHPLTPAKTHEPSSVSTSLPFPRRSLRLASLSDASPAARVSAASNRQTFLNLRSGKRVLKRAMTDDAEEQGNDANDETDHVAVAVDVNVTAPETTTTENSAVNVNVVADDSGVGVSTRSRKRNRDSTGFEHEEFLYLRSGKKTLKRTLNFYSREQVINADDDDADNDDDDDGGVAVAVDGDVTTPESRTENSCVNNAPARVRERSRNSNATERRSGLRRNDHMERFHDIARENASRFAFFAPEEEDGDRLPPVPEAAREEIEDWPGPFSTAMKIIRDRGMNVQNAQTSSQTNLCESIKWVPNAKKGDLGILSVPSLQDMCFKILVKNVDAIASLESVPDALRHRLSQLLCDSRRINGHFLELLVRGTPTEIRLRDCSWLTEEQFTECFRMCNTENLLVLQLDQCGRCLPDFVVVATLARSPRNLVRLTTLSLRGACRLSDGGLRALVSSAPALRSINLSQCSLLTSASIYILAESLRHLLKELFLDDCQCIDAALIVPALIELEHLEVLSVAGIQTVCDEFVKNYIVARGQNMKELVLKDCINLTDSSIKVIVEHCPGLQVLDLMNLNRLTDLSVGYLTNSCRVLHTLKLCRNPFSDEALAAFVETTGGSLKELSLNNIKKVGYHTTLSLANHAKNLHSLDLSWCRNLTDNALGLIVDSCLALRLLKLFGLTQVTDAFLNGHSNLQMQIIGLKMSPVLEHVKVPDPHQGALNYSSVTWDLV
ncbi:hypothetical protein LR48_Vigan04g014000 [Vigna angularis]|uniref:Rad7 n=2 Tax=Phaseolus angularis TaxID=3914 RepID=A0A0L9UBP2_PHAAN|nr:uncharacterized protein LOC108329875 [Vigna angularis]KAG2398659.1 uncharacterized protein HKW66_Vig0088600 [Vigna angularis]KOM39942.1 hypothetical protein LR48_Vigan04g014000 [Vigna angularis]BAT80045.1 hypothetical protein VIGAN_02300500 [Vigna angularis var. angularis]